MNTRSSDLRPLDLATPEATAFDLERSVAPHPHLWVGSGRSVVTPLESVTLGVGAWHAPPYSAPRFACRCDLWVGSVRVIDSTSGFRLPDPLNTMPRDRRPLLHAQRTWRIDRIVRRGHAHFRHRGRWVSFAVLTELVPLAREAGFEQRITLISRSSRPLRIRLDPTVEPGPFGVLPLDRWTWSLPAPDAAPEPVGRGRWRSACGAELRVRWDRRQLRLAPGERASATLRVTAHSAASSSKPVISIPRRTVEPDAPWSHRLKEATASLPTFASNDDRLNRYVQRCLVTGLTCLWRTPGFALKDQLATSGLDGGAVCTYLWDIAYAPNVVQWLFPEALPAILRQFQAVNLAEHFAFTPDGRGTGPWYAANDAALTRLVWAMACARGVDADLVTFLRDRLADTERRLPALDGLLDYGSNHHLLEMRSNGYEHAVPCLNSHRARNFDRLATLMQLAGIEDAAPHRRRAAAIRRSVRQRLWNRRTGWFDCLHPDGSRHGVASIRIFEVLRAGVASAAQRKALLRRVCDGDFLGPFGVHSVSPRDERRFELVDIDWSGNGAFIGEPPTLAATLWRSGERELAWDVMRRLLWMGAMLPYLPQETFAQRPATGPRGRANNIAALAGAEAVWLAMLGIRPQPDGRVTVQPAIPRGLEVALEGARFRGQTLDIAGDHRGCAARLNGKAVRGRATFEKPLVLDLGHAPGHASDAISR